MAGNETSSSSGLLDESLSRLLNEIRSLAHDQLELATLEAQLSVNTLLRIFIVSILVALVLASAWLAIVGSGVLGLISIGVAPGFAMLALAGANFVLALAGWLWIRHESHRLGWPATLRTIRPGRAVVEDRGAA